MVVKLKRPILVGGLGISFGLWVLQSWQDSIIQIGEFSLLSLAAVGGGLWLIRQNNVVENSQTQSIIPVDRQTAVDAIASSEIVIERLAQESQSHFALDNLQERLAQLQVELDRQEIKLLVTGGKSVGKTTLVKELNSVFENFPQLTVDIQETSPLFSQVDEQAGEADNDEKVLQSGDEYDFVLFAIDSDLTDSEFQALEQLKARNQQVILVFNKQDGYLADERASILQSLKQEISSPVVGIAASPLPIKVRKHHQDGSFQEWMEQVKPNLEELNTQLSEMLANQRQNLVWATTMRKALGLKSQAKDLLNEIRRDRAQPSIEQYQWIAAAAAFANPVPALDVIATVAINAQMIVELGELYQQKFSLEQAQNVASTMGSLMLKLGLVELSTKTVSTILKSNTVTFVAGGAVQGISAAYLTRIAGLALVEYFQEQEIVINSGSALNLGKLQQTLQSVFENNQQTKFLQGFVQKDIKRLLPGTETDKLITNQKAAI
ncbi:DUF697 domain-containing protein [Mastigocoleus sp. MO_188.B34]|uniref:slr1306 family protein n=1 Tax=Mastigocoleus sp. MO_188.B34 TaxID=3036635 RepID=UPI002617A621|nr:DUF697 domain-containing protein [Mastigocoleus sp. MO_188.B34]MDJ0695313.1 DUF697 domain-containing protein [Mastigocoleus sp. MO_188.B34]